jgi:tyrosyl-tRNA synthetase
LEGIVKCSFSINELEQGVDAVSFLAETGILASKGEARKMIQNGGISINRIKVENIQFNLSTELLLHKKYILVQKGKKNFYLVEVK